MSVRVVDPLRMETYGTWIPVGEMLPADTTDVLVVMRLWESEPWTVDIGYRRRDGRWVLSCSDPQLFVEPTHWMALPRPPHQDTDDRKQESGNMAQGGLKSIGEEEMNDEQETVD